MNGSIEKRLKALEKRARGDTERWQALAGEIKALSAVFEAVGAVVVAGSPERARTIILNLRTVEDAARKQNEHAQMIARVRYLRRFFEGRLRKGERDGQDP